ncbi:MAG: hypothetical protein HYX67_08925 [Candidatus Melainabacteria bacterium]|nr:hypothetical protein [Candidatus Melainabacteria bacterium]
MKKQYKIAISTIPFLLAAAVLSAMTYPKILEDKEKSSELSQKDQQYQLLLAKLQQRVKAEQEKKTLETDIETLRGAVPKSPELDLAMIDLEKMCTDSSIHLLAVETPTQESMHKISTSEDEIKELIGEGKVGLGTRTLQQSTTPVTNAGVKTGTGPVDSGLKRLVKHDLSDRRRATFRTAISDECAGNEPERSDDEGSSWCWANQSFRSTRRCPETTFRPARTQAAQSTAQGPCAAATKICAGTASSAY